MIKNTRPYKGKQVASSTTDSAPKPENSGDAAIAASPNTKNLGRRAWFGELVPAFGAGLVQLLRTGNNLREDIKEISAQRGQSEKGER